MAPHKVPFTVTYSKFGTRPPVFVAGTFNDPEWAPQEMQHVRGMDGELIFTSQVFVVPGTDYQFKFRLGAGDWWALDETLPIVRDEAGNQNNVLRVPSSEGLKPGHTPDEQPTPAKDSQVSEKSSLLISSRPKSLSATLASDLEVEADDGRSSTPIAQVASTAADVADTAALLDRDENDKTPVRKVEIRGEGVGTHETNEDLRAPLFAHESFGAYEFVDDGFGHDSATIPEQRRFSRSIEECFLSSDPDVEDPTLEKFPSDRSSIFDALRKIQTTRDDDAIQADGPFATSYDSSSRTSLDSADDSLWSAGSLSPTSTRRRDSRQSHSSVGRNKSAVSLGSIAEEDQQKGANQVKSGSTKLSNPNAKDATADSVPTQNGDDESSWLTMGSAKAGRSHTSSGKNSSTAQPRSSSKKSAQAQERDNGRHGSYPQFITNIFENSRTK